ncbi:MAG TPA: prephenate dehydratase domain-containing protein, partial [Gaiellaceae bacterium]
MSAVVAYPGPAGSHSGAAAATLHPSAELHALGGFRAVADAVARADVEQGVLPIESSLAGAVPETHDL